MEPSSKLNEFLVTCRCPDMPKYATEAFSTLFPETPHPVMLVGSKQILDEANRHSGDPLGPLLLGISKNKEKFAFYIKLDNQVPMLWDLKRGIRIP